jgi:DegV family protein with EDD domain
VPEKIALMTDSTCDLNPEIIEKYGINFLPLKVVYADRQYSDRVDITPDEIYATLDIEAPKTSVPNPHEAEQMLLKLKDNGYTHVLAIHISSGLSGTTGMVNMVGKSIEGLVVEVVDSLSLSMGLGFVVLQAARWIEEGMDFNSLVEKTRKMVSQTKVFFVVETLEYLKRNGRIGKVQATLGEFLNVKPIISINDQGVYFTYRKVRGRRRSIEEIFNIAKEVIEAHRQIKVAVMHGGAPEEAADIFSRMKELNNIEELITGQIGPVMVVHSGPGLVGIAMSPGLEEQN